MGCATTRRVQRGARVDQVVNFTDGIDGPNVAVDTVTIVSAVKSSAGAAPVGIDPASIGATITQLQDDTPVDIDGQFAVDFTTNLCQKNDVIILNYRGTITATGETADGSISIQIDDDPTQRLHTC